MGWARGFENGREVGYAVEAECDQGECHTRIDRGLSFRCGGTRNLYEDYGCGGFFCREHLNALDLCLMCTIEHERQETE